MKSTWSGKIVIEGPASFVKWATGQLDAIDKTAIGRHVLDYMKSSWTEVPIKFKRGAFWYTGKSSIECDPSYDVPDATKSDLERKGKTFVYLYHELSSFLS